MKTKTFFSAMLIVMFNGLYVCGQTIESGLWRVTIETFVTDHPVVNGNKQTVYKGILKVFGGQKKEEMFRFYSPVINGKLSHLTIRDMDDNIIEPRLYYNAPDKSFTYSKDTDTKGTENEYKEITEKHSNVKDLVLSGMLIWLKHRDSEPVQIK